MQFAQENQKAEISARSSLWKQCRSTFKWHKNCEIVLPLDKPCSFWIAGEVIHAKKGDVVFFNSRTVHSFIVDEDDTEIALLIFDVKAILNPAVKFVPLKKHITAEEIDAIEGLREKLDSLFKCAKDERAAKKTEDNPLLQSVVSAFYLLLMRHFPSDNKNSEKKQLTEFYKMVDYINEHFCENINVSILSKDLFMSREKVSSVFYKYSNLRLTEYLDRIRISNVNKLLAEGKGITEAALESGFQSIRTFNNTYKRIMGISPTEFVKDAQILVVEKK